MKKLLSLFLAIILIICCFPLSSFAAEGDTITTTLTDGALQKGSKKTFDVFARNADGEKISAAVTLNGEDVPVNWDDTEKTSFTLTFTQEGENIIVITAGDATETYTIFYSKAAEGEVIGTATLCVELFTLGLGYLIEPVEIELIEGYNAAQTLVNTLEAYGFGADYTGSLESGFYLSGVEGVSGVVDTTANFPDYILSVLEDSGMYPDYERYDEDWLGEFDYTWGSGWMYAVNNVFPNVGFSDCYLGDGDVVRVQYTLSYGTDIGSGMVSNPYYTVANRDSLTALIAEVNVNGLQSKETIADAYAVAMETVQTLNVTEEEITSAYKALYDALHPASCEHTLCQWETLDEPTFEANGKKVSICAECGEKVAEEAILMLIKGDSNRDGSVNISDLAALRDSLLEDTVFDALQIDCADINGDGKLDARDIVILKKEIAGA